jgi:hypothetical protein
MKESAKNRDQFTLSTGRVVHANTRAIGIRPNNDGLGWDVTGGYDDGVGLNGWTKDELIELADYMIALWFQFRAEAGETAKAGFQELKDMGLVEE